MNVQHISTGNLGNVGASTTTYFGAFAGDTGNGSTSSEAGQQVKVFSPGTISFVGLYVITNDRAASTWRIRKNTANGNSAVTITGSTTGQFEDTTNADAVVDNDLLNCSLVVGAGGTTFTYSLSWSTFAPTSGTQAYLVQNEALSLSGAVDLFLSLAGVAVANATEISNQATIGMACTLQGGMANYASNTRLDTTVLRTRINGVNGNIALSYLTLVTGVVEDVTNTDAVADGDEVNWIWDQGDLSGTAALSPLKLEVSATNAFPFAASNHGESTQASALTRYYPVQGRYGTVIDTEANIQAKSNVVFTWSDLYGYLSSYSLNADNFTLRSRINAGSGNLVVTWTASGLLGDTTNTDSVADDDEISLSGVTGGSSGTIRSRMLSSIASVVVALSFIPPSLLYHPDQRRMNPVGYH